MSDDPIDVEPKQPAAEVEAAAPTDEADVPAEAAGVDAAIAEQLAADAGDGDAVVDAVVDTAVSRQPADDATGEERAAAGPGEDVFAEESAVEQAVAEEPAPAGMDATELTRVVEALVFASPEPISPKTLYKLLAGESKDRVSDAINELKLDYLERPGLHLVEVAGGYQITTRPELHDWVRRLFHERSTQKLSVAALESLAVIAYRQPVTALEVTEIRGVNASGVLSTLLERNLIKIVGRKNVVGRPFMYGTTKEFLIRFGLKDLGELPRVEDMAEALGFDPPMGLVEQAPREEMLPLEEGDEGAALVDVAEEGSPSTDVAAAGTEEQPEEGSPSDLTNTSSADEQDPPTS